MVERDSHDTPHCWRLALGNLHPPLLARRANLIVTGDGSFSLKRLESKLAVLITSCLLLLPNQPFPDPFPVVYPELIEGKTRDSSYVAYDLNHGYDSRYCVVSDAILSCAVCLLNRVKSEHMDPINNSDTISYTDHSRASRANQVSPAHALYDDLLLLFHHWK